jgi:2Fe-2S ferredoxin
MPRIIYRQPTGERREVEVPVGHSVMEGAVDNGVNGILGDCGGACACATCHAYIADDWLPRLPAMDDMEDAMLDSAEARLPSSRLTCQIEVTPELDGLELTVAPNEL